MFKSAQRSLLQKTIALVQKGARASRVLGSRYPGDPRVAALRRTLSLPSRPASATQAVALEVVEDPLFFGLFNAVYEQIRSSSDVRADLVVVRSVNGAIGIDWKAAFWRSLPVGRLISSQWIRAFPFQSRRIAYRSLSIGHPVADLRDAISAGKAWRRLRQTPDECVLTIDDIPVGDLVIDTYLRFRPSPKFDAGDRFVLALIHQCFREVRLARAYFSQVRPKAYLTTYSTYLQHGIAVRVALAESIRVISFGSPSTFGKELSWRDWFHTKNTDFYRRDFANLGAAESRLKQASAQLQSRFAGQIDPAMAYMRASAYAQTENMGSNDVRGSIVVFLHDFFDSPHIYDDILFSDFWQWADFTIRALREANVPFFLKPHPNQIELSGEALQALRAEHPDLRFLSAGLTNTQLVEAGMACGVTMYGSVAHELAYHGIPTIACARHPHHAFDFCRTARSRDEYRELLQTPYVLPLSKDEMRRQALEFYYMHNLNGGAEELELRSLFHSWWHACGAKGTSTGELIDRFNALRRSPAFHRFCERLFPSAPSGASSTASNPGRAGATPTLERMDH